ncbi:MAG: hypothetical protein IJ861_05630 [Clostridia bacterium]|nr:hypothetical protein [Clostridia bacterium]
MNSKYRIWSSTNGFAEYIVKHTLLSDPNFLGSAAIEYKKIYESDANNPKNFHTMPDHIRKILYLDACDLIVEMDNEPILSIEITTEAGTGHNSFQRFARIAASVENDVPAFYIYPEGAIVTRKDAHPRWDRINPLIFRALDEVMNIYRIPALLYYYPSDIHDFGDCPEASPNLRQKGLHRDAEFIDCPDAASESMQNMFLAINRILMITKKYGILPGREKLLRDRIIHDQHIYMQDQYYQKSNGKSYTEMSPLSAVFTVPTEYLINYLSKYTDSNYEVGELIRSRQNTKIYQVNAHFRGDPYPGALSAIDYLVCRTGKTFEDRDYNLVLLFGKLTIDDQHKTIQITDEKNSTINDFINDVKNCSSHNLLTKNYHELKNSEIPRYFMQVRYGSTYSKAKHIRVFSYFADVILFPDGSLWRDA